MVKGPEAGEGRGRCWGSEGTRETSKKGRNNRCCSQLEENTAKSRKAAIPALRCAGPRSVSVSIGLKAIGRGRLTARQIEAARRAMTRHIKRGGRIWIRIFPGQADFQETCRSPYGKRQGNPEYYVAEIKPGKVLYEMDGVSEGSGA
jgi:large subunit ribosomal protein L16